MLGVMTTRLSEGVHKTLQWLDLARHPPIIRWSALPDPTVPLAPSLGFFLNQTDPHVGLFRENIWWKYRPDDNNLHARPFWWETPIKEVSETSLYMVLSCQAPS